MSLNKLDKLQAISNALGTLTRASGWPFDFLVYYGQATGAISDARIEWMDSDPYLFDCHLLINFEVSLPSPPNCPLNLVQITAIESQLVTFFESIGGAPKSLEKLADGEPEQTIALIFKVLFFIKG